ncbi:MAG TPA: hypothetical protein DGG94_22265 [Micromonosporaceae bacterium]|nr:hypothetical protein [Micromonosporaceae bacterium]
MLSAAIACRRGVPAARPDGLGALVAGTVGWPALIVNALAIAAVAVWAVPGRPWQGPAAVAMAIVLILVLQRHLVRRLGGITGDVLGFLIEVASTLVLIGLCAGALPR